ncbi:TadE/TadG family type IV pilus assembly protein [Shinella sp.]|uniref:TadE/TadG family type IV pilus assembly protein n=1 Tax=Shinella sp. TaxID=1870904 RepID=UPI0028A7F8E2|nr:TadE/TadG family type IV pilus assembly protein [Shinella sp.]
MENRPLHKDSVRKEQSIKVGALPRLRRFVEDRRGVGAIEFAIVAPLLIMAYVSAFEISVAVTVSRKINRASATVSDLLTQNQTTNKATLDTMKTVTKTVIAPFSQDGYSLKITGIAVAADGKATVAWSRDQNEQRPYATGLVVTLPSTLEAKSTFIVRTELTVPYTLLSMMPSLASSFNKINLSKTSYFRQRTGDKITCSDC